MKINVNEVREQYVQNVRNLTDAQVLALLFCSDHIQQYGDMCPKDSTILFDILNQGLSCYTFSCTDCSRELKQKGLQCEYVDTSDTSENSLACDRSFLRHFESDVDPYAMYSWDYYDISPVLFRTLPEVVQHELIECNHHGAKTTE